MPPPKAQATLRAAGIGRRLEGRWVFRSLSFALDSGSVLGLSGPSGAGKTLLLRALATLDRLDEGRIEIHGSALDTRALPAYRARVAYVAQRPVAFEGSVEDNLRLPFRLALHAGRSFDRERVLGWLTRLGRDQDFLHLDARRLSGGEVQIMALLRSLQLSPLVLLVDEPTAALDPEAAAGLEGLVQAHLAEGQGRACVWASHDQVQLDRVSTERLDLGSLE